MEFGNKPKLKELFQLSVLMQPVQFKKITSMFMEEELV